MTEIIFIPRTCISDLVQDGFQIPDQHQSATSTISSTKMPHDASV